MKKREDLVKKLQEEAAKKKEEAAKKKRQKAAEQKKAPVSTATVNQTPRAAGLNLGLGGILNRAPSPQLNNLAPDPMEVFGPATFQQMYPYGPHSRILGQTQDFSNRYHNQGERLYNHPENSIAPYMEQHWPPYREQSDRLFSSMLNAGNLFSNFPPGIAERIQNFIVPSNVRNQYASLFNAVPRGMPALMPPRAPDMMPPRPVSASSFSSDGSLPDYLQPQNMPAPYMPQINWPQQMRNVQLQQQPNQGLGNNVYPYMSQANYMQGVGIMGGPQLPSRTNTPESYRSRGSSLDQDLERLRREG